MGDSKEFMLGYLIGMRYTDACIYTAGKYKKGVGRMFDLQAIDKEMVEYTANCLNKVFERKVHIRIKNRLTSANNKVYQCSTTVKKIEKDLSLGKIKIIEQMKGFVSAFFDAEGNISIIKINSIRIILSNTNKKLILKLGEFIKKVEPLFDYKIDIINREKYGWKTIYILRLKKGRTKNLFFETFSPKIKRKIKLYTKEMINSKLKKNISRSGECAWARRNFTKPALCENCGKIPPMDIVNTKPYFKRDINNFKALCRGCSINNRKLIKMEINQNGHSLLP